MARYPGSKQTSIVNENIGQDQPINLGEIGELEGIEPVSEGDFVSVAQLEAFMNEILTIVVHDDNQEGALDVISPSVNGVNQPIIRGVAQKVRRKYVEVLARGRTTKYTQPVKNMDSPDALRMVPSSKVTYPFTVVHDPNPNGRPWIEAIMREA